MKNAFTIILLLTCMVTFAQPDTTQYVYLEDPVFQPVIVDTSLPNVALVGISPYKEYDLLSFRQAQIPIAPQSWFPDFERGDYARNFNDIITQRRGNPAKVIGLYLASIALNAVGDGLNDSGNKQWGHACNAMSIGIILMSPFVIDYSQGKWWDYLLTYTFLRVGTFDIAYNATRGNSLNYVGGDNLWDRTFSQVHPSGRTLFRGMALTMGVSIPINELGRRSLKVRN